MSERYRDGIMEDRNNEDGLKPFFKPRSVAVIGASRTPGKGGYNIIENLLKMGYSGRIYPINPRAKQILGLKVYASLNDTPDIPDLALVVLPPAQVLPSLEECAARGVMAVIVESAGFSEMDDSGAWLEERMSRLARQTGMRIMGPNSVGTIDTSTRFDASLGRLNKLFLPQGDIVPGNVGFICQTGLVTGVYLPLINSELGISRAACLGNRCDVDENDVLEYFAADSQTKIIAMYLESIRDGRRFMEISRRVVRDKPVLVLKSAVTKMGAKASATHTGSIAGEDRIYDAAFRQVGIIRVTSFEQLWDFAQAFIYAPLPAGKRVAIVNLAGSGCVTAVDACVRHGMEIAELSPATEEKIKRIYPDWWHVRSPVDVWTAIEASGFEVTYTTATRAVMEDDNVDAVVVVMGAIEWLPGGKVSELFRDIRERFPQKPLIAVNPLGDRQIYIKMCRDFQALGIPSYTSDDNAIAALAALYRYRENRSG
jgi:acyl-CoA synthetase (NDP forming)